MLIYFSKRLSASRGRSRGRRRHVSAGSVGDSGESDDSATAIDGWMRVTAGREDRDVDPRFAVWCMNAPPHETHVQHSAHSAPC